MSEKEKKMLENMEKAIPEMPDYRKGYFVGYGVAMADKKEKGTGEKDGTNTE